MQYFRVPILCLLFYLWARNPFLILRVCLKCLTSCNCLIWKPLKATENLFLEKFDDSRWLRKGVRAQLKKSQQSFGFSFLWKIGDSSLPKAHILLSRDLGHILNLPRDSKISTESILWPIFGTAETLHISPPDAILMRMQLFWSLLSNSSALILRSSSLFGSVPFSAQGHRATFCSIHLL